MKRLVIVSALLMSLVGCSSMKQTRADAPIPSPTPAVTKDQTVSAQGRVENAQSIDVPAWYIKAPASTEDYVYVTGTAVSSDLSMSRQKALLDAQVQLADKINGVINALTKQNRKDDSGSVDTDRTQITVKKLILDTAITGYHLEDTKIMAENRGYRTFVLVRYPMGDANRMLKDKLRKERQDREDARENGQNELDREMEARKPAVNPVPAPSTVKAQPLNTSEIKLMDVDNAEYKARRDAALQKPNAVIGQVTVQ
jgi:hypothetical protein